jgi:ElaB/YqjD/DUF883 family membrane-anchored ribosome-binding protein
MADEPEVIRDQMQETRTALTEKLEALESQVSGTVQSATAAVTDTVQAVKESVTGTVGTVKDTVQETVSTVKESVRDAFDLPGHVERHPWVAMLGSVAVGYVAGRLLNGAAAGAVSETVRNAPREYSAFKEAAPKRKKGMNGHGDGAHKEKKEPSSEQGVLGGLANAFADELDTLKGLGLSAVAGVVRDLVTQSVGGEVGERLRQWMNDVTEKMGAKPLSEPLLQQQDEPDPAKDQPRRSQHVNVKRETLPRP